MIFDEQDSQLNFVTSMPYYQLQIFSASNMNGKIFPAKDAVCSLTVWT